MMFSIIPILHIEHRLFAYIVMWVKSLPFHILHIAATLLIRGLRMIKISPKRAAGKNFFIHTCRNECITFCWTKRATIHNNSKIKRKSFSVMKAWYVITYPSTNCGRLNANIDLVACAIKPTSKLSYFLEPFKSFSTHICQRDTYKTNRKWCF